MTVLNGWQLFDTPGIYTFTWQSDAVMVEIWGGGGAGGGSQWQQFGGGGASGAWGRFKVLRPASGTSTVVVGNGGNPAPANTAVKGGEPGNTSFDSIVAYSLAAGGTAAGGPYTGGEGGAPVVVEVPDPSMMVCWVPGGMGQPAAPVTPNGLNGSFPMGADSPGGGRGSGNQQAGLWPGGGGAPGNISFPSGAGGNGRVLVYW